MPNESMRAKLNLRHRLPNVAGLFLAASGLIILAWVGWLTWYDMTSRGKNIVLIFFGSRTGEAISLGIGMKVIHYLLISLALLLSGLVTFLRRRSKRLILQDLIEKLALVRAKLVAGLTLITILGVSLYLSPIRGNTVAVVGAFASLSAIIIAFLAAVEIEIINVEEEYMDVDKISMEETYAYEIMSNTAGPQDFSHTNMNLRKTSDFQMDIYSSENQLTLSSHYAPRRAHFVELPRKKRQVKRQNNKSIQSLTSPT